MADAAAVCAEVGAHVGRPADDAAVVRSVQAAARYVWIRADPAAVVVDPAGELPDDELTAHGLVTFGVRMYRARTANPAGASMIVGDDLTAQYATPEDIWRHVHHYFDHLVQHWGIA